MFLNRDAALHDVVGALLLAGNKPMPLQGFLLLGTELVLSVGMKHNTLKTGGRTSWLTALALVALAGCGGGGDEDSSAPATSNNSAPTIQGAPGSAVAGQTYSFQPTASDPDGDTLTFSVANLPAWASFNQSNGRISGTPAAADVATYSNIRITVSDGEASASTSALSITVNAVGNASVTLSWTPPTQNDDGSTLTDLAGYEVLYGRSQGELDQSIQVTNPSVNTFVVDNLSAGTWFFALRSVNRQGTASQTSAVASKTVS